MNKSISSPRPLGLIGGMSWESTLTYYQVINRETQDRLGGVSSARIFMDSLDFAPIEARQSQDDWEGLGRIMATSARTLERAGAGLVLICTNTMHRVAPAVEGAISIPLLHIADATAQALCGDGIKTVGLLGTAYTMEQDFYTGRLTDRFGLEVLTPGAEDRAEIHRIIFQELVRGIIDPRSRARYLQVVDDLAARGAQAVILGCTEIGLLLTPETTGVPLYDTARLHALAAVNWSLAP